MRLPTGNPLEARPICIEQKHFRFQALVNYCLALWIEQSWTAGTMYTYTVVILTSTPGRLAKHCQQRPSGLPVLAPILRGSVFISVQFLQRNSKHVKRLRLRWLRWLRFRVCRGASWSLEASKHLTKPSGWRLSHPSEKYESHLGILFPIFPNIWKNKCHVPNHQPAIGWNGWNHDWTCTEQMGVVRCQSVPKSPHEPRRIIPMYPNHGKCIVCLLPNHQLARKKWISTQKEKWDNWKSVH